MTDRTQTAAEAILFTDRSSVRVLWAALHAMVNDVHAPQDNLSEDEWKRAEEILKQLDEVVNV